jgi:methylglutaconyl-CoA hydratase
MSGFTSLAIDGGIARLTLNRPEKRNALRREIIESLLELVRQVAANESVRVLVLAATGEVFCAGMDLGEMQERAAGKAAAAEYQRDSRVYCELLTAILELQIPTIAAVHGPALAGGMGLVCACDLVIAAESAFFMLPEPMRGITAAMVTPLLVHRMGPGPAGYMLLSEEKISAVDARRMGLCHDIVPLSEIDSRVNRLIRSILGGSPAAFAITKQHIRDCLSYDLVSLVRQSVDVSAQARETADAREGLAAFLEKRSPSWQDQ